MTHNKTIQKRTFIIAKRNGVASKGELVSNVVTKSASSQRIQSKDEKTNSRRENILKKGNNNGELVSQNTLQIQQYNLYWVKLRGYCMWPAIVEGVTGANRFVVHFFGDYTRSTVYRNSLLYNFADGFVMFNNEQNASKNLKLCKSVNEASMFYARFVQSQPKLSCCICDFLKNK